MQAHGIIRTLLNVKPRAFKNPQVLHEMLLLRLQGWPLKELAFRYSCHITSVRKACLRCGLPQTLILLPRPRIIFKRVYLDFDGERINQGKDYKEYLKELELKRQLRHPKGQVQ